MKRPKLNQIPVEDFMESPGVIVTMSFGQWDQILQAAYNAGHILLEVDDNEMPVKAYRKDMGTGNG